ncbi:hypothetical protein J4Q44_G00289330 [Coregonus suidteri]|uniref:Uncharacterized protein n=1 Tax=Coregonus suidteri TaxID=861788 RepID=A0AAN8L8I5_9TELE
MEKSQYGPPQDVSALPYPAPQWATREMAGELPTPLSLASRGGGPPTQHVPTTSPVQHGHGTTYKFPPAGPQPGIAPTTSPVRHGHGNKPTNAPGITQVVVMQQQLPRDVPGPDDVSPVSGPGSDRDHTHHWNNTAHMGHLWSPLLLPVLAMPV